MRRRRAVNAPRTAAEVLQVYNRAQAEASHLPERERWRRVRADLLEHGTDPLEALRARLWLRRGRTDDGWQL